VPYFVVAIQGDADRARGLLGLAGIQNLVTEDDGVAARILAENGDDAVRRVRMALEGEPFKVGDAQLEQLGPSESR
jgi:hypothetical protein